MRRIAARLVYQTGPVCFACGRRGAHPCPGHEYGGVITGWRVRWPFRRLPLWLYHRIDCRWTLNDPGGG